MAVKKHNRGKIVGTFGYYDIRQVLKHEGYGKAKKIVSSTIAIYHGKRMMQDGFKNTQEALAHCQTLLKVTNK